MTHTWIVATRRVKEGPATSKGEKMRSRRRPDCSLRMGVSIPPHATICAEREGLDDGTGFRNSAQSRQDFVRSCLSTCIHDTPSIFAIREFRMSCEHQFEGGGQVEGTFVVLPAVCKCGAMRYPALVYDGQEVLPEEIVSGDNLDSV